MDEKTIFTCPNCHEESEDLDYEVGISGTAWGYASFDNNGNISGETEDSEYDHDGEEFFSCRECGFRLTAEQVGENSRQEQTTRQRGKVKPQKQALPQEPEITDIETEAEKQQRKAWDPRSNLLTGPYYSTNAVECPYCEEMILTDENETKTCTNCGKEFTIETIIQKHNANE